MIVIKDEAAEYEWPWWTLRKMTRGEAIRRRRVTPSRWLTRSPSALAGHRKCGKEFAVLPSLSDRGPHECWYIWGACVDSGPHGGRGYRKVHLEQRYPPNHAARAMDINLVFGQLLDDGRAHVKAQRAAEAGARGTSATPLEPEQRMANYTPTGSEVALTGRQLKRLRQKARGLYGE
jgi:hypothetical protein